MKTFVNGKASDCISVHDRGLQYGDGLFETMRVSNGRPPLLKEHLNRLKHGCQSLNIEPVDGALIKNEIERLAGDYISAIIKIVITRGAAQQRGYCPDAQCFPTRIVYIAETDPMGVDDARLTVCKMRLSNNKKLAGIKHLNRLENVLAAQELAQKNFNEGILLNHNDYVIECTKSNIFYIKNKKLYTPDLSQCGVSGILRSKIIDIASQKLALQVHIENIQLDDLLSADEVFIGNSVMGIQPVVSIDQQQYCAGELTGQLTDNVFELFK